MGVSINAANWIWIGIGSMSATGRISASWPLPAWALVVVVSSVLLFTGIGMACAQPDTNLSSYYLYLFGAMMLAVLLFSVISGVFVSELCWGNSRHSEHVSESRGAVSKKTRPREKNRTIFF